MILKPRTTLAPTYTPVFPVFKEITLDDRNEIMHYLAAYRPVTSELTFTSLFMWRHACRTKWSRFDRWLLFLERHDDGTRYFLPPIGEAPPPELIQNMLHWLRDECGDKEAAIERADSRIFENMGMKIIQIEPMPEHFD